MNDTEISKLFDEESIRASKISNRIKENINPDIVYENINGKKVMRDAYFWEYCFTNFIDGSDKRYNAIAKLCKKYNMSGVCDIGCSIAFQAKIFKAYGLNYIGIDRSEKSIKMSPFGEGIKTIVGLYPFDIELDNKDNIAAISDLCIGYECSGDNVTEHLTKDFKYFCGYIGPGCEHFFNFFDIVEEIECEGVPLYFAKRKDV